MLAPAFSAGAVSIDQLKLSLRCTPTREIVPIQTIGERVSMAG